MVNLLPMQEMKLFDGSKLRAARKARGFSQSELGRRIGAHVTSISDWEREQNAPSGRHIAGLARELGISVGELYGDDSEDDEEADAPLSRDEMDLYLSLHARVQRQVQRVAEEVSHS